MSLLSWWRERQDTTVRMSADEAWGILGAAAAGARLHQWQVDHAVVRALLDLRSEREL